MIQPQKISEGDAELLTASYRIQLDLYRTLRKINEKIIGKLAISRGDIGVVTSLFIDKQHLISQIEAERKKSAELSLRWQNSKELLGKTEAAQNLDNVLSLVQEEIRGVVAAEEQLTFYLPPVTTSEEP